MSEGVPKGQSQRNSKRDVFDLISLFSSQYRQYISNSEYFVRNPVQATSSPVQSSSGNVTVKYKTEGQTLFEYFWLGMTLRPKGFRNLFYICSKSTHDWLMDGRVSYFDDIFYTFHDNRDEGLLKIRLQTPTKTIWGLFSSCIS